MLNFKRLGLVAALVAMFAAPTMAAPEVGVTAPEIEAVAADGSAFKLSDLKGKTVVLEWTNHDCPFVRKHYDGGNMQSESKIIK